jgi:hypothetical protein
MNYPSMLLSLLTSAAESAEESTVLDSAPVTALFHMADRVVETWLAFLDWLGLLFKPVMQPIFAPINSLLVQAYMPWARICAMGLFGIAILWVCFGLKKEYVHLGRPNNSIWTDLRLWTIIAMLPHIFVYLFF